MLRSGWLMRNVADSGPELRMRASGGLADRVGGGRRLREGLRPRYSPRLGFPRRSWKSPPTGLLPENAWQSEERGMGRRPRVGSFVRGTGEGRTGPLDDPVRTSTAVAQRQFGPRPGGRTSSTRAAAVGDSCLPEQGHFPVIDPPCADRGIPRSVRVNDSAVVPEEPLDQGPFEPFGVQK